MWFPFTFYFAAAFSGSRLFLGASEVWEEEKSEEKMGREERERRKEKGRRRTSRLCHQIVEPRRVVTVFALSIPISTSWKEPSQRPFSKSPSAFESGHTFLRHYALLLLLLMYEYPRLV